MLVSELKKEEPSFNTVAFAKLMDDQEINTD
jgi:hypothetical protein